MKLKIYIAVSLLMLVATDMWACGWVASTAGDVLLYRIMPIDEDDYGRYGTTWDCDNYFHKGVEYSQENIVLWQKQTSKDIKPADIEYTVYEADAKYIQNARQHLGKNTFMNWIVQNKRTNIINYLMLAKQMEDITISMEDPWYYSVDGDKQSQLLENIVAQCKKYKPSTLSGRYTLQMVRALCALRKYRECVDYWNSVKKHLPDNVIRKMVELKAASAIYKVGNKKEALRIYAKYGDVASIRAVNGGKVDNELEYVYNLLPNSPYIEGELQKWLLYYGRDGVKECIKNAEINGYHYSPKGHIESIIKVAKRAVREQKSKNIAMWYYTLASLYDTMGESRTALMYLNKGDNYPKTPYLKNSYRVLHMWLDARTAKYDDDYEQRLMSDLKWLDRKIPKKAPSTLEIEEFPQTEYAKITSDGGIGYQEHPNTCYWNDAMRRILLREVCPRMHKAGNHTREIQLANLAENRLVHINAYCNEMFVIMDRHSYNATKNYFSRIYHPQNDFDKFLNSNSRIDKYYWYDILGTICLREQRYSKAIVYLKQIPLKFQHKMNAYEYMDKDPFSYDKETIKDNPKLAENYKLHFAERMAKYHYAMKHERNRDKRADAMIQYALGLRNSVHECWVLTRYSSDYCDEYVKYSLPEIAYPEDSTVYRYNVYMKQSDKLINKAILCYRDREKAASQLRKFLYFKRIMKYYGDTQTAKDIRLHCDRWRDYV